MQSMEEIYQQYAQTVYRYLCSLCHDPDLAEELTQETFYQAIRSIDHSLVELRGQWSSTGVDSKRMEIENHIGTLQELLSTLQSDSESLLEVSVYVTAYDIAATRANLRIVQPKDSILPNINDMKRNLRRTWQENGFRLNNMEFDQVQAFIGAQVNALDPMVKDSRGISSNTVAACFPWVFAHISDEGGVRLGESDGLPVFINFFRRDSERVNSNMVIVGKSGSGKSYATQSLLANLAAEDLLPAGWEIENMSFRTSAGSYWFQRQLSKDTCWTDARDDRMLIFPRCFDRDDKATVHYAVRAVSPGTYTLPSVTVTGMYDPTLRAVAPAPIPVRVVR